jgi:hypothetical protein
MMPQPVDHLSYLRRGGHIQLTWIWPDESLTAIVQWHCDGDPAERTTMARCSRRVYEHDGGFVVPIGLGGATFTVEAMLPGGELDARPPSPLRVDPQAPIVMYDPEVRGLRRWTISVTFSSELDCELPPALVVLGTGRYRPSSVRDGQLLQEIPARPILASQPVVVSFETAARKSPCWVVCLRADPQAPGADLRPVSLHRLKVR